ncbi:MAG: hydrolase [Candidatus Omnitrophota bacterium]
MNAASQPTECCPPFNPTLWDDKTFEWNNKKFVKDKVFTLFYIPINFGSVMKRLDEKVRKANAIIEDGLGLSDHTSKWNMDVYVAVDKEVPGLKNTTLSGKFLSKVYEGDFKETGNWCKDFEAFTKSKNLEVKKWYMWYTTCPKCAKKYGKNYVAIMGQVE